MLVSVLKWGSFIEEVKSLTVHMGNMINFLSPSGPTTD